MRPGSIPLLSGMLVLGALGAHAAEPATPPAAPIRPVADCLEPDQVMDWGVVDQRRVVVKSLGKRYYDIRLGDNCPDLLKRPYLSFREGLQQQPDAGTGKRSDIGADPVTHDGRICGDLGDAAVPRSAHASSTDIPCRIGSIRRIDEATYEGVFPEARPQDAAHAGYPRRATGAGSLAIPD